MALRASSLQSTNTLAINREIGSKYDAILDVSKHLADTLANADISGLIDSLNEAKDFTGITVVTGETPSWDAVNKILTVPVEKGDAGENGRGIVDIELTDTVGLTKTYTINYTDGTSSTFTVINGADGINGVAGKSVYQLWLDAGNEGTLNEFLEAMRGPVGVQGDKGDVGLTGLQGISVHHIKGTSTTDLEGDFASYGEIDTYTLYGDAAETIDLGYFRVNNGLAKEGQVGTMFRSTYDTNNSGIVDDAEKLNGLTAQEIQSSITDLYGQPNGIATLDGTGLIPAEQLPSYVDDVIEVNTYADLPVVGESSKIYVVIVDETSNGDTTSYRWTGTVYAVVSNTLNASDVKALYEANPNTNAYTDAEKSRIDINIDLTTTAQTLPTAVNEIDNRVANIEDNTTLAEYGITDAYTKTEVQETLPAVGLDTTNTVAPIRPGQIKWNQNEGTADLVLNNGVTLQLGQENTRLVRNATSTVIPNMTVCMFDGTLGNSDRIKVAPFTGLFNQSQYIYGIATQSINAGEDGYITIDGKVRNVDTTGAAVGETWLDEDILYVKPNNAGHLTKVVPADDELKMPVASVIHAHVNGTLEVRVLPFNENMIAKRANKWTTARTITLAGDVAGSVSVDGSADVTITTTVQPNSVELGTDTTGNYMVNVTAGSGISVLHTQGEGSTATITNSAPNVTTNITTTHTSTNVVVNSSDGTDGTINSATQTLAGVMSAADKTKLDGIEAGATGDQTASEILTLLKTVDGSGSGVDADLLDGQEGTYYLNASNINTGTINDSYLPDTITSDITGNANTATKLATPRTINGVGFDGTANIVAPTNLTIGTITTTAVPIESSSGTNASIPAATTTLAGVMSSADKVKLDGIATGATANTGTVTSIATSGAITGGTITSSGTISHSTSDGYLHVPATGTTNNGKVLTAGATAGSLSWATIPSAPVTSVAGKTGDVTLVKGDVGLGSVDNTADLTKNVLSATKLTIARTINGVDFDGTDNIIVYDSTKLPKINPEIVGSITEQVYNLTGTEINPANGTIQYKNVSTNTTFTETLISGQSVLLRLIDANSYTITFPTITWIGATAPTLTANCAIVIWKEQSTLYGAYLGTLI